MLGVSMWVYPSVLKALIQCRVEFACCATHYNFFVLFLRLHLAKPAATFSTCLFIRSSNTKLVNMIIFKTNELNRFLCQLDQRVWGSFTKKTRYINSLLLQLAQAAQAVHRTET